MNEALNVFLAIAIPFGVTVIIPLATLWWIRTHPEDEENE